MTCSGLAFDPTTYPVFWPEEGAYAGKRSWEWTRKEAEHYFNWLMTNKERRVNEMLGFVRAPKLGYPDLLPWLGRKLGVTMKGDAFWDDRAQDLTNVGSYLACDVGLFWAQDLLEHSPQELRWAMLTKPRHDLDYQLPVIEGFSKGMTLNPVQNSMNRFDQFLSDRRSLDSICGGFRDWESYL